MVVSAVVLFVIILTDGVERKVTKLWLPLVCTLVVGVSLGMPLFLYLVEVGEEGRESPEGKG